MKRAAMMSLSRKDFYRPAPSPVRAMAPLVAAATINGLGALGLERSVLAIGAVAAVGFVASWSLVAKSIEALLIGRRLEPALLPAAAGTAALLVAADALLRDAMFAGEPIAGRFAEAGLIALAVAHLSGSARTAGRIVTVTTALALVVALAAAAWWFVARNDAIRAGVAIVSVLIATRAWLPSDASRAVARRAIERLGAAGIARHGEALLEGLARADEIILRRRVLLTRGRPRVEDVVSLDPDRRAEDVLRLAAAAELGVRHPIRDAILDHRESKRGTIPKVKGVEPIAHRGVRARLHGREIACGSLRLLAEQRVDRAEIERLAATCRPREPGQSVVLVSNDGVCVGYVTLRDPLRAESTRLIADLKELGLRVRLLTGDDPIAYDAIRREAGDVEIADECAREPVGGESSIVVWAGAAPNIAPRTTAIEWIHDRDDVASTSHPQEVCRVHDRELDVLPEWIAEARRAKRRRRMSMTFATIAQVAGWLIGAGALAAAGLGPTPLGAAACALAAEAALVHRAGRSAPPAAPLRDRGNRLGSSDRLPSRNAAPDSTVAAGARRV